MLILPYNFKMQIYKKKMKNPTHFTTNWIYKDVVVVTDRL